MRPYFIWAFSSACVAMMIAHGSAGALTRQFPVNSREVTIQSVSDPWLKAGGKTYHMPPGLLIFSANNMTIVRSALPSGIHARIQLDLNGDLRRIWILNPEEVGVPPAAAAIELPIAGPTEKLQ